MSEMTADAVVIGAGPGGYVCAIRLAQLGLKTVIVDRENLGGVCLNWGCIPSKALIHAGKVVKQIRKAEAMGITVGGDVAVDMPTLVAWKDDVVKRLTGGVGQLMKGNKIEVVMGRATLEDARTVRVEGDGGTTRIRAGGVVLATGSRTIELPGMAFDGERVLSSRQILSLQRIPEHLIVIGGGVIGLELGQFFHKVGAKLTVIEMMDQLLPGTDPELVKVVARELKKAKVAVHLKSKATALETSADGVTLTVETPKGTQTISADALLVTVGRRPNSDDLGLEAAGVTTDARGFVCVNDRMETTAQGVFAIGDLVGMPLLAHKASKEGLVAAEALAGKPTRYDVRAMPGAIFTDPEIATVGLTEVQAREAGYDPIVGKFGFPASGRALSTQDGIGFVKAVGDRATNLLLGVGIVGPEASTQIAEAALAIEMGATLGDVAGTVHAHPTLPEGFMEACEAALGHAIHVL